MSRDVFISYKTEDSLRLNGVCRAGTRKYFVLAGAA